MRPMIPSVCLAGLGLACATNAFAIPGGHVYVTRGILAHLNSEAELAVALVNNVDPGATLAAGSLVKRIVGDPLP